jgi:hypothetical protein
MTERAFELGGMGFSSIPASPAPLAPHQPASEIEKRRQRKERAPLPDEEVKRRLAAASRPVQA